MLTIPRNITTKINYVIDECVPPLIRDSFIFSWAARLVFKNSPWTIENFKEMAFEMSDEDFRRFYLETSVRVSQGETDLSTDSAAAVINAVIDGPVLEVGCGGGWLAEQLGERFSVVGTDITLTGNYLSHRTHSFIPVESNSSALPFRDAAFPTVVCTHTLEHVTDFQRSLSELRRVCSGRLIIVVPRQRAYRTTFSPHIHFFPYRWSVLGYTGSANLKRLDLVGGDWLLIECCAPREGPPSAASVG